MTQDELEGLGGFIAELKHWRAVRGLSQEALASKLSYSRSYVSKIENGRERPSAGFVSRADSVLQAGGALSNAFVRQGRRAGLELGKASVDESTMSPDLVGSTVLVEHDDAHLVYDGSTYTASQRRRIRNVGHEPVVRYLMCVFVDRFPGLSQRSKVLYRSNPLTLDELQLSAWSDEYGRLTLEVHRDLDSFKEVWLLFENPDRSFPLYPGDAVWLNYRYTVTDDKWGNWFQRATRFPTRNLSVRVSLPRHLDPIVWGVEISTAAPPLPFRRPLHREVVGEQVSFSWGIANPPLHTRYRLEWEFRARPPGGLQLGTSITRPSALMASLGIVQRGDPILTHPTLPFDLPREASEAEAVIAQLNTVMGRVGVVHPFAKGRSLSAPQIGVPRAAAVVQPLEGEIIALLNPHIVDMSLVTAEHPEGCVSFFDVRGLVSRPVSIEVQREGLDGMKRITHYRGGIARLVSHEIDHLNGLLYTDRMAATEDLIPIEDYDDAGLDWRYLS